MKNNLIKQALLALLFSTLFSFSAQAEPKNYIVDLDRAMTLRQFTDLVDAYGLANIEILDYYTDAINCVLISAEESDIRLLTAATYGLVQVAEDVVVQLPEQENESEASAGLLGLGNPNSTSSWGLDRIDQKNLPLNNSYVVKLK